MDLRGKTRPLAPPVSTPEVDAVLAKTKFYRPGKPLQVFDALLHHPFAMQALKGVVSWGELAVLSMREREILIVRTATRTRCAQELSVHGVAAVELGWLTRPEVADLAERTTIEGWSRLESALVALTDSICRTDTVADEDWASVSAHLSPAQIIEALVVVGYYRMVCGMENALGVPAEVDFTTGSGDQGR